MRFPSAMALAALCLSADPLPLSAEVLRMQPDFTFRRVAAPAVPGQPRITVQIDPTAPRLDPILAPDPPNAPAGSGPSAPAVTGAVDWFWAEVSPALQAGGVGRFDQALRTLAMPPVGEGIAAPRLQTLQTIADRYGVEILTQTVGTQISPALILAIISVESAGRHDAVSHAGAQGLMQLMPATAARFGVGDSFDTAQNIRGGVAYLDWLRGEFGGDPILMLAGYNAGEGNVKRHGGVPPFAETRAYVPKVLAAWQVARGLCRTRPELITDGCVLTRVGT